MKTNWIRNWNSEIIPWNFSTCTENKTWKSEISIFSEMYTSSDDLIDTAQILRVNEYILQFGRFWADFR